MSSPAFAKDERGVVLILVLMALAVITALVTEFAYGVYTSSTSLYNWRDSQSASLAAAGGASVAVNRIAEAMKLSSYTYPGRVEAPLENIFEGSGAAVFITIEDENARFNLNSLVYPNGGLNDKASVSFKRLLDTLGLDPELAGRVADWIDKDGEPRLMGSEDGVKNGYLDSVDELLLVKGVDRSAYEKLSPYVTVWGIGRAEDDAINVNTADVPVIMSLDERITRELAERAVSYRDLKPFENAGEITKVAGFEGPLGTSLMGRIAVKSSNFHIRASAVERKIKRVIDAVIEVKGGPPVVRYWMES